MLCPIIICFDLSHDIIEREAREAAVGEEESASMINWSLRFNLLTIVILFVTLTHTHTPWHIWLTKFAIFNTDSILFFHSLFRYFNWNTKVIFHNYYVMHKLRTLLCLLPTAFCQICYKIMALISLWMLRDAAANATAAVTVGWNIPICWRNRGVCRERRATDHVLPQDVCKMCNLRD